jgi:hypothetical protein
MSLSSKLFLPRVAADINHLARYLRGELNLSVDAAPLAFFSSPLSRMAHGLPVVSRAACTPADTA